MSDSTFPIQMFRPLGFIPNKKSLNLKFIQPIFNTDYKGMSEEELKAKLSLADVAYISILAQSTLRYGEDLKYLQDR